MITRIPLLADTVDCGFSKIATSPLADSAKEKFKQRHQAEFEAFLRQEGKLSADQTVPDIFKIAPELLKHLEGLKLGFNRYGLQSISAYGKKSAMHGMRLAKLFKLNFLQVHTKNFSKFDDTAIQYYGITAKKAGIEIQIDISSTDSKSFDEAFRIAKLLGNVKIIRTYIREPGTINEMMDTAVAHLREAADRANELGITVLLEQHEVLQAFEINSIINKVNRPNLKALFDFANPITAGTRPDQDLEVLNGRIQIAHVKDAIAAPTLEGGYHQIGVKIGEGDLPVNWMIFRLIMNDVALSAQPTVGYIAPAADRSKSFKDRPPSWTYVSRGILESPEKKHNFLNKELWDAHEQTRHMQWIRAKLEEFAKRAVSPDWETDTGSKIPEFKGMQSRESRFSKKIESIGENLFPNAPKQIWAISPEMTEAQWRKISKLGGSKKNLSEAMTEILSAQKLKETLSPPLYSPTWANSDQN